VKYTVRVDGREVALEVIERGGATWVRTGGREIPADARRIPGDGAWTLRLGGRNRVVVVASNGQEGTVTVGSRCFRVSVEDEREAAAHAVRPARTGGPRVIRSVMPGIVREVSVAKGAVVAARTPLLVLEAMKMQNEVRADGPGTVVEVHVAAGKTVAKGDALVTIL
jgi:biotin carboxyl carrier protein